MIQALLHLVIDEQLDGAADSLQQHQLIGLSRDWVGEWRPDAPFFGL